MSAVLPRKVYLVMLIRRFVPLDAPRVCEIYYRSVHEVARAMYDREQLEAWAPQLPDHRTWLERLTSYDTFVAENDGSEAVAWIATTPSGYVDMLFALPEAIGRGIASGLYRAAEDAARARGVTEMTAHASLLAQPFFAKHGWFVVKHEMYVKGDVHIPRAAMAKRLASVAME